jgi:hypothetical protein
VSLDISLITDSEKDLVMREQVGFTNGSLSLPLADCLVGREKEPVTILPRERRAVKLSYPGERLTSQKPVPIMRS